MCVCACVRLDMSKAGYTALLLTHELKYTSPQTNQTLQYKKKSSTLKCLLLANLLKVNGIKTLLIEAKACQNSKTYNKSIKSYQTNPDVKNCKTNIC